MRFKFHPFELFVSGYSGSGKTTLIKAIISRLKGDFPNHRIAYLKTDTHGFSMDREGKDTWLIKQTGADLVSIFSQSENTYLSSNLSTLPDRAEADPLSREITISQYDFCLIEGFQTLFKRSPAITSPQIYLLDDKLDILDKMRDVLNCRESYKRQFLIARTAEQLNRAKIHFPQTGDRLILNDSKGLDTIVNGIVDIWQANTAQALNGLILCGGQSSRMGEDKAAINYHGRPQALHIKELLAPLTQKVFFSFPADRMALYSKSLTIFPDESIFDAFPFSGPLNGIISALAHQSNTAWLVVASDLPMLDSNTLNKLIAQRSAYKNCTYYLDQMTHLPEPLCAIYEPRFSPRLVAAMGMTKRCPRQALLHSGGHALTLDNNQALINANYPDERDKIKWEINYG